MSQNAQRHKHTRAQKQEQSQKRKSRKNPYNQELRRVLAMSATQLMQHVATVKSSNPFLSYAEQRGTDWYNHIGSKLLINSESSLGSDVELKEPPKSQAISVHAETQRIYDALQSDMQELVVAARQRLHTMNLPSEQHRVCMELLNRLDPSTGYLELGYEAITDTLAITSDTLLGAIKIVQSLEPPGIAARDLRECCLLQIERILPNQTTLHRIVRDHWSAFCSNDSNIVCRETGISESEVQSAYDSIKKLKRTPARFAADSYAQFAPSKNIEDAASGAEFIVTRVADGYSLSSSIDTMLVHIKVNEHAYLRLSHPSLEEQKMYLQAVHLRSQLIARRQLQMTVREVLISLHKEFFDTSGAALTPSTHQHIADMVGCARSTVSLYMKDKYLWAPWNDLIPFKTFFKGRRNQHRCEVIRDAIAKVLDQEDVKCPYTDAEISAILNERGHSVDRRSVTNHRNALGIPSSNRRARLNSGGG